MYVKKVLLYIYHYLALCKYQVDVGVEMLLCMCYNSGVTVSSVDTTVQLGLWTLRVWRSKVFGCDSAKWLYSVPSYRKLGPRFDSWLAPLEGQFDEEKGRGPSYIYCILYSSTSTLPVRRHTDKIMKSSKKNTKIKLLKTGPLLRPILLSSLM